MKIRKIFAEIVTPNGNQAIAELDNGQFAVGQLNTGSSVPEHEQFTDMDSAFDSWYELIHEHI